MSGLKFAVAYPTDDVQRFIDAGYWTEETPQDWLAGWAAKRPDATAAVAIGETVSYGELFDQARRIASGLLRLGLRRGDVVGVQLPNSSRFMAVYHGIQMMGGVVCLLHMPYRAGELGPMLAHVQAKAIVCFNGLPDYDAPATMHEIQSVAPSLETVIVAAGDVPDGTVGLGELLAGEVEDIADPPIATDPSIIAFTSGTSASPKAVVHSHRSMASSFRLSVATTGWGPDDVVLSAPSFTHAFGIIVLMTALCAGSAASIMPAYTPQALADTIRQTRTTSLCCGPAHVYANARAGLLGPEVTNTLNSAFVGGAATPPDVMQILQDACQNGTVYQIWGMTEVLLAVLSPLEAPPDVLHNSIGKPSVGHDVRVVDTEGTILGTGEEGELQIRGPFLFHRYFENDDANQASFTSDNWFRTGDLMTIDSDGNLYMTGRVKDVINRGGIKINPIDIELLLDQHPAVAQCAVIPMPDEVLGERACLIFMAAPDRSFSLDDMRAYLEAKGVAKMRWPEKVIAVDSMPMTPTRKIIKGRLVSQVSDQLTAW